jgi:protein required for attachment to host cells
MKKHWVLIANASHARLLQQQGRGTPMTVLMSFSRSDAGGAHQPRTDARQKEHQRFARELAEYVERHAQLGSFDSFTVFASSPFLGQLKAELGAATGRRLAGTHDSDLTSVGPVELPRRIEYELAR